MPECIRSPDLSEPRTWDQPGVRAISSDAPQNPRLAIETRLSSDVGVHVLAQSKILVVDEDESHARAMVEHLRNFGMREPLWTRNTQDAYRLIHLELPDLLLLDIDLANPHAWQMIEETRDQRALHHMPILVLTPAEDTEKKLQALLLGATDVVNKPVDSSELMLRVRNALFAKRYQDQLSEHSEALWQQLENRTAALAASRQEIIHCLACAAEYRDNETGQHVIRVGMYAAVVAEVMGCTAQLIDDIEQAAKLHDVGKIGIPDTILLKQGRLTAAEEALMRKHCVYGRNIIQRIPKHDWDLRNSERSWMDMEPNCRIDSSVLAMAATIAETHHERWDGHGYPSRLRGEDIPLVGRITAVCDVFDAVSSRRPYKPEFPLAECFEILEQGQGSHFDRQVVTAFAACRDRIVEIHSQYQDQQLQD